MIPPEPFSNVIISWRITRDLITGTSAKSYVEKFLYWNPKSNLILNTLQDTKLDDASNATTKPVSDIELPLEN